MSQASGVLYAGHQTMVLAHRAMVRDLDRVGRAAERLAVSPDPGQAVALREYVDKLFQLIEHHHEGEDEYLWPRLRQLGADEEALTLMITEHADLSKVLHSWHDVSRHLGTAPGAEAEVATLTAAVREQLARHAGDEERELAGRFAPVLDRQTWKGFATHMRKTAPGWTLKFMPAWLSSVAGPGERGGVPAPPVAALFRGWLEKRQRAAFGEDY
ncbi:hemerythrin domain-containing protein [Streptomyces sp. NPDC087212]|uniref:hemerythrin domain-containing protein n=1 Tax=Streptomyces sp. NPDC087212 TaxID=3365766 RepID=UPI0037F44F45